ncbi:phage tail protein [Pseudoroseomonas deserti]|uniref:Phage tail protein n=1 Tax=Teichococcus deserti TaxID=1817963 RepID=A0A1V2H481_9PROT|nr:phage tail protein [Pseudoroseomonas deserti]ONG55740.1 phage tail protein [Pseudoroseomonas deserti]
MAVYPAGSLNLTAQVVPDTAVNVIPPQTRNLNGVPTNGIGIVGTASFGPKNTPVVVGSYADYVGVFGNLVNRKYDMGTHVATAHKQGANSFVCVRVTDGTDVAASVAILATCLTVTAAYTGSAGNSIKVDIGPGAKPSTFRAVVSMPGAVTEVFDNIAGSGNALWVAMAAAINNGTDLRSKSALVTATAGAGTTAPATATYSLASGTDGTTTINDATLVGLDNNPGTGMYALKAQPNASILVLADTDTTSSWAGQLAFAKAESFFLILTGPAGQAITAAVTAKNTAGIDDASAKVMFGDWIQWQDPVNKSLRLISPQGFVAGRYANLSIEQSGLNKPIYDIVGTQKTNGLSSASYSTAELQTLFNAGIDVITNPVPGGNYFGLRGGVNASSNPNIKGDEYTRQTNYIAQTISRGTGIYVGELINQTTARNAESTLNSFFANMLQTGQLALGLDGSRPYKVTCDVSNNPQSRTALGYLTADVQVRYQGVVRFFIVNLEAGASVTIIER